MKRIPVYIEDDVDQLIRHVATEERRPFNSLVREALVEYLEGRGVTVASRVREPQTTVDDPEWRERFLATLESMQADAPQLTPEEIEELEAEIDAVVAEVREERWQRSQQPDTTHD